MFVCVYMCGVCVHVHVHVLYVYVYVYVCVWGGGETLDCVCVNRSVCLWYQSCLPTPDCHDSQPVAQLYT